MIIVLGMHRSGTSLVSGLLHHMGVFMGDVDATRDINPWNHYEDQAFVNLNKTILSAAGSNGWWHVPSLPKIWAASHPYNERIQRLIRDRMKGPLWGFKDPRTCLTLPLWHRHLSLWESPRYVVVWRDSESVIHSLMHAASDGYINEKKEAEWLQLVGAHWARVIDFLVTFHPDYVPVWYESLMDKSTSENVVEELAKFCGVEVTDAAMKFIQYR